METFRLSLPGDIVVTGRHSLPPRTAATPVYRPLIVGLHGGTYTSAYFDATETYSARVPSAANSIPFVGIERPGYGESTPVAVPAPEGSSFPQEWGTRLHKDILPALWNDFGVPNGCNCVVIHCHSLGANGAIIAAALHADEASPAYPLAGLSLSGFGSEMKPSGPSHPHPPTDEAPPTHISIPVAVKDSSLLLPGTAAPEVFAVSEALNHQMPLVEVGDMRSVWFGEWRERWASRVRVPVMIGLAELDNYWVGTDAHAKAYGAAFQSSERVDTALIRNAPHNIELSYWSQGWYARCFGFALECAASMGVAKANAV